MDQAPNQPDSAPTQPAIAPEVSQTPEPKAPLSQKTIIIIGGLLTLAIIVFGFLYIQSSKQAPVEPEPMATPTIVPTPTPPRNLSRIATTSAFAAFGQEIASFAATLDTFSLQDSTLAPPSLDLELGL